MSKVINMLGGSGIGKSTTASELFSLMKQKGFNVELVREYIKEWCWTDRPINEFTQPISYGVQLERETQLYGKVDYIITDSPLILYPVYQQYNYGHKSLEKQVLNDLRVAKSSGVDHINFVLSRPDQFDTRGRFESENQAKEVDAALNKYLAFHDMETIFVNTNDYARRVNFILGYVEALI